MGKRENIIEPVSAAKFLKPENIKQSLGKDKTKEDIGFIQNVLKQHYLLFSMTSQDINLIIDEMALCEMKKGEVFIK